MARHPWPGCRFPQVNRQVRNACAIVRPEAVLAEIQLPASTNTTCDCRRKQNQQAQKNVAISAGKSKIRKKASQKRQHKPTYSRGRRSALYMELMMPWKLLAPRSFCANSSTRRLLQS